MRIKLLCTLMAATLMTGVSVFAQSSDTAQVAKPDAGRQRVGWVFGAKLGILTSGEINVSDSHNDYEFSIESGLSGGFSLELPTRQGVSSALTFDFHRIDPERLSYTKTMLDFGILLKRSARDFGTKTLFRPFLGISYGYLGEVAYLDPSHYLIVKAGVEIDFFPNYKGAGWLLELGMLGSPHGKADRYDITAPLRPYLRFGLTLR